MPTSNKDDIIIAFRNLYGEHTGATQAFILRAVFDEYDISRKFHCFVSDNAGSNDSTLIAGANEHPNITIDLRHRVRCAGHIINLIVKATIYGKGVSRWEEQLAATAPRAQFQLFRKIGVVGRLHNFVNAICISHKRREAFNEVRQEVNNELLYTFNTLELRQDDGIRWNSVYLMLLRCLELKASIDRFVRQQRDLTDAPDDPNDAEFNALHD